MGDKNKNILYVPTGAASPRLNPETAISQDDEGLRPLGDPYLKVPFRGGAITSRDRAVLDMGSYSMVQNFRGDHPGFTKRKGQRKLHDTADGTNKVMTVYQFKKDRVSEKHFYAQFSDGDVLEATNHPPVVATSAVFGTVEAHDGTASGMIPASWGNMKDKLIYSNGSDQHQIYAGDSSYVQKFIVYKGDAAIPTVPKMGLDFSIEVSDGSSATVAVLDSLSTAANHDYFFIKVPVPVKSFTITVSAGNDNVATMTIKYWKSDMTWTAVGNLSDGTLDTGTSTKTLNKTGTVTFDAQTDCLPKYHFGQNGFWYRFEVSAALDAEVEISAVTFDCDWQDISNVWDGVRTNAIEIQFYDASASVYYTFGSTNAEIDDMTTSDKLYFSSADPVCGIYVDVGDTPNTATTTTIPNLYYWTGSAWAAVSNLNDGTSGLTKSGWILFDREDSEPTQFNDLPYKAYWYYFVTGVATVSSNVIIGIQCMPYFDITEFGIAGYCNGVWKNRVAYTFNSYGEYLYISAEGNPLVLNGADYGILRAGDGRSNRVVSTKNFQNELLVWQQERGVEGGCVTLFEGYSPTTFGKLILSSKIGSMNAKCTVVVDGVNTAIGSDEGASEKTLAFWLSKYGVCVTDGNSVSIISGPIQNYFDPKKTECIRRGYEAEMWLAYDSSNQVLRIGLVSGTSATLPNIFPVFDLIDSCWYFDVLAQELACMCECEAESGDAPIVQVGGGIDDGFVYQLNYGTNDVATAITSYVQMELNGVGEYLFLRELLVRMEAQASGNLDLIITKNALTGVTKTLSMVVETASQIVRRHRVDLNMMDQLLTLKFQSDGAAELLSLYDLALKMYLVGER